MVVMTRDRRRERHDDDRGPRALPGQRPLLRATSAATSTALRPRAGAGDGRAAQIPLAQIADVKLVSGPSMIRDENGLLAGYVYVDVAGPRHRRLRRRGEAAWSREQVTLPRRLLARVERPVREHAARPRAAEARRAGHALPRSSLLLYLNTRSAGEDGDRPARGAVLGGRRDLAPLRCSATT